MNDNFKKAVELAIDKGGYDGEWDDTVDMHFSKERTNGEGNLLSLFDEAIVLDPLFWQSLGKALGWKHEVEIYYTGWIKDDEGNTNDEVDHSMRVDEWQYWAFGWLTAHFEGEDDEFWNNLLK